MTELPTTVGLLSGLEYLAVPNQALTANPEDLGQLIKLKELVTFCVCCNFLVFFSFSTVVLLFLSVCE
jgi:hypothetical protein